MGLTQYYDISPEYLSELDKNREAIHPYNFTIGFDFHND